MSRTLNVAVPDRLGWLTGGALVGVLSAVLVSPALGPVRAQTESEKPEHTLTVSGTGIVTVKPDIADVTVGVTVQRDNAQDAAADAANVMAAVVDAIKALGIAEDDIQTTSLNLGAVYDYETDPPRLVGYQARNLVTVTVRDITQTGAVVDAATGAGATDVNSISFRLEDQTAAEAEAREQAVLAARAKADTIAAAAGVTITGVVSIDETSAPIPYPEFYASEAADAARAPTPVLAGTIELSVSVTIVYQIP